jgi:hypothetical protein
MEHQELYRQAYANYRQWIEADLRDQTLPANWRMLAEQWQQYLAFAELAWDGCSTSEDWQRLEKISAIDHQYACMFRFEMWRLRKAIPAKSSRDSATN